jgi:catechol 2,3-dioxygenase-like lactoylglutathione lyase family enzyme
MSVAVAGARLDHVGVMVTDIDAAVDWYVETFGFDVADRWADRESGMAWAHLELDGMRVEFVQRAGLERPDQSASGYHHIALVVVDCAEAVIHVVRAGAEVVFAPSYFHRHDMDWSFVRDPFGNILELISYRNPPHIPKRP